jgi:hypothetical protein
MDNKVWDKLTDTLDLCEAEDLYFEIPGEDAGELSLYIKGLKMVIKQQKKYIDEAEYKNLELYSFCTYYHEQLTKQGNAPTIDQPATRIAPDPTYIPLIKNPWSSMPPIVLEAYNAATNKQATAAGALPPHILQYIKKLDEEQLLKDKLSTPRMKARKARKTGA